MHLAVVDLAFGGGAEPRLRLANPEKWGGGVGADLGAVLEPAARSAAGQQHFRKLWMDVDQEVAVRAVLILADLCPNHLRALERGEAPVTKGDDLRERLRG